MTTDPPERIIICAASGDWVEWRHPSVMPAAGDCPFGDCDCTPVLYELAPVRIIKHQAGRLALAVAALMEIQARALHPDVDDHGQLGKVAADALGEL